MWQELKRIVTDKRVIIVFIIMIVLNGYFVYKDIKDNPTETILYGEYNRKSVDNYLDLVKEYKNTSPDEAYDEVSNIVDNGMGGDKSIEYARLKEQLEYLAGYKNIYPQMLESAKVMYTSTLFTSGGFSQKELDKSIKDYKSIADVKPELSNEKSVQMLVENKYINYFNIFLIMMVVLVLLEERKRNLWNVVYSTKKGRSILAFYRIIIIAICSIVGILVMFIQNMIIATYLYGGLGNLSRPVQSNPSFADVTYNITMWEFLIQVVFWKVIIIVLIGILLWLLSTIIRKALISYAILIIIMGIEYYLFATIPIKSSLNYLHYINIFSFLDSAAIMTTYKNINIFGNAVLLYPVMMLSSTIVLIILVIISVLNGNKKPLASRTINIFGKIPFKIYSHMSIFLHELYKVLISQKMIIVLIAFIIFIVSDINTQKGMYDYSINTYKAYLEQIKGPYSDYKLEYLEEELNLWKAELEVATQKGDGFEENATMDIEGEYTEEDYIEGEYTGQGQVSEEQLKRLKKGVEIVTALRDEALRLKKINDDGTYIEFVDKTGYTYLVGDKSIKTSLKNSLLILAMLILSIAGVQAVEHQNGTLSIIRITKKGRIPIRLRKYLVSSMITTIITLVVNMRSFYEAYRIHGLDGLDAPVQSLYLFKEFKMPLSIIECLVFICILRVIMSLSIMFVILFISEHQKNIISALIISSMTILLPSGLYYIGLKALAKVSVIDVMSITNIWNNHSMNSFSGIAPIMIILLIGIGAAIFSKRENNRKVVIINE